MIQERHTAEVVATDDPEKRGRIRIKCSGILGDEETDLSTWIEPLLTWGFFLVPDIGEIVEVVIDTCSDQDEIFGQTSITNPNPQWLGARYYQGEADAEGRRTVPEEFTSKNYGKRRGFKTPAGHVLIFDDTQDSEELTLACSSGPAAARKQAFVSMDAKGSIVLSNATGTTIYMNAADGQLAIIDQHGNTYASDSAGMKIVSKQGYFLEMKEGVVQLVCGGNVVVQANNASIKAAAVDLGNGADQFTIRGVDLMTWLNTHTHTTPLVMAGPANIVTSPPVSPAPPTVLSTTTKVK